MNLRSLGLGIAAIGATVGVAETHLATIEVIKNTTIVLGLVWTVGKFGHLFVRETLNWGEKRVKAAVRDEIRRHFVVLPCVKSGGAICDDTGEFSEVLQEG